MDLPTLSTQTDNKLAKYTTVNYFLLLIKSYIKLANNKGLNNNVETEK